MTRIDQMTRLQKADFQRMLIREKYLAPINARGRPNDDGIWGDVSASAYARYLEDQIAGSSGFLGQVIAPPAAKPWWQSRRGQGLIKMGLGFAIGLVGNFWEPAAHVNTSLLLDTIFNNLPTVLEALGIGVASWGVTQSAIGAAQAQAPLMLRAPSPVDPARVYNPPMSTDADRPSQSNRSQVDRAKGGFSDAP
jgi:hypothetical protein